jgi:hypothetical protein
MWGHMGSQGYGYMMAGFTGLIWLGASIWFIVFTILVVVKLDRIIKLLKKK